ncbi:Uncharacterised protein [Bordetella pertussis]|nr:Uncharacterised protein [Bordetella pertussis]CFM00266.1 Uncharacterised protein [Bordetella pertussis]CFM09016.1 Uncharacterised protein [Bordetella pertussis]CFM15767.1 Uncharacterised protein [Bordetella pertussis]CFM31601.1 Uncharacterised protein [Bordetella pertussis]
MKIRSQAESRRSRQMSRPATMASDAIFCSAQNGLSGAAGWRCSRTCSASCATGATQGLRSEISS